MINSIYDVTRPKEKALNAEPVGIKTLQQPLIANVLPAAAPAANTDVSPTSSGFGLSMSNYGNIAMGVGTTLDALPKKNDYNNDQYTDKVQQTEDAREKAIHTTKDTVASAFGPWGALFRGIEKGGNAIGDSIGGDTGNYISAAFSPDEAIMAANSDPDVKIGDKILGTILPFHAAKVSKRAKDARKLQFEKNQKIGLRIQEQARSEADQRMEDGLTQVENLRNLKAAQLGILKSNY